MRGYGTVDALFNVYKPSGPTSHDVVIRLRRASGVRRIGHAGTLDPLAEGVLLIATGRATRVLEYLAEADKAYRARVTFGVETETYDAEGRVVAERPVTALDREQIERALARFRGRIEQQPPPYAAIRVGGRRLYQLARRGEAPPVAARRVEITRLELLAWEPPVATLEIECSKGTYIRSLAHDLGAALGCGAHLSGLVRTRVGSFEAKDAVALAELEARLRDGTWPAVAIAPDIALASLPALRLEAGAASRLAHGLAVDQPGMAAEEGALARAYGPDGTFLAVVRRRGSQWQPEKVFVPPARGAGGA